MNIDWGNSDYIGQTVQSELQSALETVLLKLENGIGFN